MARLQKPKVNADGWTDWIPPVQRGYKLACCDCGLIHTMDFKVVRVIKRHRSGLKTVEAAGPEFEAMFRASRNYRSTALKRRHMKSSALSRREQQ